MKNTKRKLEQQVNQSIAQLIDAIEAGRSERLRQFLAVLGRFHRYSLANQLLIAMQRPEATRVAGYRTWQQLGRQVRRGERGIRILAPVIHRVGQNEAETASEERDEAASPESKPRRLLGFRPVSVFDVTQTDGTPLPELARATGDPGLHTNRLVHWLAGRGIAVETATLRPGLYGSSHGGRIQLSDRLSAAELFATLVHEAAHELLHHEPTGTRPPRTVRETEAEAVAFAVCTGVGIAARQASCDYIQLYGGDGAMLEQSLQRIRRVAGALLDAAAPTPGPGNSRRRRRRRDGQRLDAQRRGDRPMDELVESHVGSDEPHPPQTSPSPGPQPPGTDRPRPKKAGLPAKIPRRCGQAATDGWASAGLPILALAGYAYYIDLHREQLTPLRPTLPVIRMPSVEGARWASRLGVRTCRRCHYPVLVAKAVPAAKVRCPNCGDWHRDRPKTHGHSTSQDAA